MEVSLFYGIVDSVNTSVIVEQFVVDSHVVIKEIELSVSGLLHVHLGHPVVGEVQGNVATREREINTTELSRMTSKYQGSLRSVIYHESWEI